VGFMINKVSEIRTNILAGVVRPYMSVRGF